MPTPRISEVRARPALKPPRRGQWKGAGSVPHPWTFIWPASAFLLASPEATRASSPLAACNPSLAAAVRRQGFPFRVCAGRGESRQHPGQTGIAPELLTAQEHPCTLTRFLLAQVGLSLGFRDLLGAGGGLPALGCCLMMSGRSLCPGECGCTS